MSGLPAWRSLHSVMVLTVYVALVSYVIRMTMGPGSTSLALFLSLAVAIFLIWPMVRAVIRAIEPGDGPGDGPCRACQYPTLAALYRRRNSTIPEVAGYRCARCGTTYRQVGAFVVEEPPIDPTVPITGESEIRFEVDDEPKDDREA